MDNEIIFSHESEYYKTQMNGERWDEIRAKAIEFYGAECKACKRKNKIDIHHLSYKAWNEQRDELMEELVPLCRGCHDEVHRLNDLEKAHRVKSLKQVTEEYIATKSTVRDKDGYLRSQLPTVHKMESKKGNNKRKREQANNFKNKVPQAKIPISPSVVPQSNKVQGTPNQAFTSSKTHRKKVEKLNRNPEPSTRTLLQRDLTLQHNFIQAILQQAKGLRISIEAKNIVGQIAKEYDQDSQIASFVLPDTLSLQILSEIYKIWIPNLVTNSFTLITAIKRKIKPFATPISRINTNKSREEYLNGKHAIDLDDRTKRRR